MGSALPAVVTRAPAGSSARVADAGATLPRFVPLASLVVRAPLLPMRAFRTIAHAAPDVRLENARTDARIRTALAIGGGDLLSAMDRAPSGRQRSRVDASLLRYLIRMSSRPTPYGLFAGVALAEWANSTDLRLDDMPRRIRTRIDMGWLMHWIGEVERQPELRHALRLVANPAVFERAGRLCLTGRVASDDAPSAGEVSIRKTAIVERLLGAARTPIPHSELVDAHMDGAPDTRRAQLTGLIDTLWAQRFLLTELRPPLTSSDPAEHVLRVLTSTPVSSAADAAARLGPLLSAARDCDQRGDTTREGAFRGLGASAAALDPDAAGPSLQVDSALGLRGTCLSRLVAEEAARAAELLLRVTPLPEGPPQLAAYRRAFLERYGPDRVVPLLEVLDPERGLGPLAAVAETSDMSVDAARTDARNVALLELAARAARDRARSIELSSDIIGRLDISPSNRVVFPETLELNVFVGAANTSDIDAGEFTVVVGPNVGATAAGKSLGRFADLLGDPAVHALRHAVPQRADETSPIDAELVYLPDSSRLANVAIRPALHAHEIVVGASPGVASSNVIPLGELALGVARNRLVVWWTARGREVRVHAGHMLNSFAAPPVCRLLAEVGQDGLSQLLPFDWGPAESLPFLPRVSSGRVVLRPAQWRLLPEERMAWLASEGTSQLCLAAWRRRWSAPRYVHVGHADNRLLLDLQCGDHRDELRAALEAPDGARLVIQEALPVPTDHWLRGPGGTYAVELVVPLARRAPALHKMGENASPPATPVQSVVREPGTAVPAAVRLRAPGSDWLYAKLYCPRSSEEDLLVTEVAPLCEELERTGMIDGWFFVRYQDDASHLRLRLRGQPAQLAGQLMPEMCRWAAPLIANGRCTRLAFDTYEREIERFDGARGLEIAEAVFCADSRATSAMLGLIAGRALSLDRTALGLLSLDRLLASLGMDEQSRLVQCRRATDARHAVGELYRRRKRELRTLLSDETALAARLGGATLLAILAERDSEIRPLAARLRTRSWRGSVRLEDWCASVAHLHCNRLLGVDSQAESVLLALLLRTREGLAQARSSPRSPQPA